MVAFVFMLVLVVMLMLVVAALAAGVLAVDARKGSLQAGDRQLIRIHSFTGEAGFDAGFGQHDQRPLANRGNHHHIDLLGCQPLGQGSRLVFGSRQPLPGDDLATGFGTLKNQKLPGCSEVFTKGSVGHWNCDLQEHSGSACDCVCLHRL